jgi:putative ABC transport system permease protein
MPTLNLRPILSTLARHRIAAGLIVFEVALALAFVSNALHMIAERVQAMQRSSGFGEHELRNIDLRALAPIAEAEALTQEDLRRLRALPGVKGVAVSNQVIYGDNNNSSGVNTAPNNEGQRAVASSYQGDEHFLPVHGLQLVAGRNFLPEEVLSAKAFREDPNGKVPALIINRALAEHLFPGQSAVGKPLYVFNGPSTIVGVVETLSHTSPNQGDRPYSLIAPLRESFRGGTYVLRVEPGRQQAVLKEAAQVVREVDPRRSARRSETLLAMRANYYAEYRAMSYLLAGVCTALLAVTAFGIVGLVSFWVAQRTRMIGVRRALGATRGQIRGYFQIENLLLCGAGVLIGMAGALALSTWVMQPEGAPALPWIYLPAGALLLLVVGQLAVLAPARKAASLPAAAAMRS